MAVTGDDDVVVGVAITVPEPWSQVLRGARAAAGDPEARAIPPHVTLLAPAKVAADELDQIDDHLEQVASRYSAFDLHLRGTGTFRPVSPVVFVQVVEGIALCEQIAGEVRSGLLDRPLRFPYHPHVTIGHDVPDDHLDQAFEAMADFDAAFSVTHVDGYVQDSDGVWQLRRSYALR
jgi:2'-5' RNA ligase